MTSNGESIFYKLFPRKKKEKVNPPTANNSPQSLVFNEYTMEQRPTKISSLSDESLSKSSSTPSDRLRDTNSKSSDDSNEKNTKNVSREVSNLISQSLEQSQFLKTFDTQSYRESKEPNLSNEL